MKDYNSAISSAEKRAEKRTKKEVAKKMVKRGTPIEYIIEDTGLSAEEIQNL